ncbi:unnamed protein product [Prunus armeniaca]|uniref:Uncharacterized protein n=1 Tax=Prunus armeniaca TaxID=36596 RepID=A0A6J5WS45_PRUAR|nr:unnamed protein product [Prunus armeniaca]
MAFRYGCFISASEAARDGGILIGAMHKSGRWLVFFQVPMIMNAIWLPSPPRCFQMATSAPDMVEKRLPESKEEGMQVPVIIIGILESCITANFSCGVANG